MNDLSYAFRRWRRRPILGTTIVVTLAVGIGVTAAAFSLVNALLLRDLPVPDADELVRIVAHDSESGLRARLRYDELRELAEGNGTLAGIVGVRAVGASVALGGYAESVSAEAVTANYFRVLGLSAERGALFPPELRDERGVPRIAVISHALRERSGAGSAVVGRAVEVDGRAFTVVGVAPEGFRGSNIALARDLWIPLGSVGSAGTVVAESMDQGVPSELSGVELTVLARTRPGVTREQAEADLTAVARRAAESRGRLEAPEIRVLPERAGLINPADPRSVILGGILLVAMAGLGLLVACANVAGMLLSQAVARRREMGLRLAIGAGRLRLVRQLLVEDGLLALIGGALGVGFAVWAGPLIVGLLPAEAGIVLDTSLDWRVVGMAILIVLAAALAFGLAPALWATREGAVGAIREASARTGERSPRLLKAVVGVQFATAFVVLVVTGLLLSELSWRQQVDPGFATANRLLTSIRLPAATADGISTDVVIRDLVRRFRAVPGVRSATAASRPPLTRTPRTELEWQSPEGVEERVVGYTAVETDYFGTLGIRIVAGRDFGSADDAGSRPVGIVNEALARELGGDVIGRRLATDLHAGPVEIVGVASQARYTALAEPTRPFLYVPLVQHPTHSASVLLHVAGDPAGFSGTVRGVLGEIDPALATTRVLPLRSVVDADIAFARTLFFLAVGLSVSVLLLGAVGLYGVVRYASLRRVREVGIRLALGATPAAVTRLMVRQGMRPIVAALAAGLIVGAGSATLLVGLLPGVPSLEPVVFVIAAGVLGAVATVASYLPARGAAQVDPMQALRVE